MQGYNAQAVTTADQIVIAAEVTVDSPDFGHLEPMVRAALAELDYAGVTDTPDVVLADAGYWHQVADCSGIVDRRIQVIVPPDADKRKGDRPGWHGGLYAFMRRVLATDRGGELYAQARGDDRAGLRAHEVQPAMRPLPTPRQIGVSVGMAVDHRHPQPAEAPPPPDRGRPGPEREPGHTLIAQSRDAAPRAPAATATLQPFYATATMGSGSGVGSREDS